MGVALVNGRTGAAPPLPTPMDAEGAADAGAAVAAAAAGGNAAAAGGGKADSALTESVRPLAFKTLVGKGHHEFSSARQQVRRRKKRVNFTVGRRPVYMLSCTHSTSMLSHTHTHTHTQVTCALTLICSNIAGRGRVLGPLARAGGPRRARWQDAAGPGRGRRELPRDVRAVVGRLYPCLGLHAFVIMTLKHI